MDANKQANEIMTGIMAKASTDESFRQRLRTDAAATLRAEGVPVPEGMKVNVLENTPTCWNLVLPPAPSEELSDEELEAVAGGPWWAFSDRRLKTDVSLLERLPNGLGLYSYRYVWCNTVFVGVMAQEVAAVLPGAVTLAANGYLAVDYARLGLRLMTLDEWTAAKPPQQILIDG